MKSSMQGPGTRPLTEQEKLWAAVCDLDRAVQAFILTVAPLKFELHEIVQALPGHYDNRLQLAQAVAHERNRREIASVFPSAK